jgi:hypothetical protein
LATLNSGVGSKDYRIRNHITGQSLDTRDFIKPFTILLTVTLLLRQLNMAMLHHAAV